MLNDTHRRMRVQLKKIMTDKWRSYLKTKLDPGDGFILKWINKNSSEFSKKWEKSLCKTCVSVDGCGYKLLEKCDFYSKEKG